MALSNPLSSAVDPTRYSTASIDTVKSLVTAALPECLSSDYTEITQIMNAVARGPYRASILPFQPHIYERPLYQPHVKKLIPILASADLRIAHLAFIFISDDEWLTTTNHQLSLTTHTYPVWQPVNSAAPPPLYLTHGHRFAALKLALNPNAPDEISIYEADIRTIYGDKLEWVVKFLPMCLLNTIPASLWASYVVGVNQVDKLKQPPSEEHSIAAWIMNGFWLAHQILYPLPNHTYNDQQRYNPALERGWASLRLAALQSGRLRGEWVLAHPRILLAMASAFETPIAKDTFVKARIDNLSSAFCWPQSAYLELAAYQLRGFKSAPWRNWTQYHHSDGTSAQISLKRATTSVNASLGTLNNQGSYFAFTDPSLSPTQRHGLTQNILNMLRTSGPDASTELQYLFDELNNFSSALQWPTLDTGDTPIHWVSYFYTTSVVSQFQKISRVVFVLVWILMGKDSCNLLLSGLNVAKTPGHLRWSKSPDSIILLYFQFARKSEEYHKDMASGRQPTAVNYTLPTNVSIDKVYADAKSIDLLRLYRAAAFLMKHGEEMCNELEKPLSKWFGDNYSRFVIFSDAPDTSASPHNFIYPFPSQEKDDYSTFRWTVNNLGQHSVLWQRLLFDILQVDLLDIEGEAFYKHPDCWIHRNQTQPQSTSPVAEPPSQSTSPLAEPPSQSTSLVEPPLQSTSPLVEPPLQSTSPLKESSTSPPPDSSPQSTSLAEPQSAFGSPLTSLTSLSPLRSHSPLPTLTLGDVVIASGPRTPSQWSDSDRDGPDFTQSSPLRRSSSASSSTEQLSSASASSARMVQVMVPSPSAPSTPPQPLVSAPSTPPQSLVSAPSTPPHAEKRAQDQVDLSPPQQPVVSHPPKRARLTFIPVKQNRTMSQAARPQSGAPDSDDDAMDHGAIDIPKWQEALQSNQTLNDEANSSEDGQDSSSELHASVNPTDMDASINPIDMDASINRTDMEGALEDHQFLLELMVDNFSPRIMAQMHTILLSVIRGAIRLRDNNNMDQLERILQEINNGVGHVMKRDDEDIVEDDNMDV